MIGHVNLVKSQNLTGSIGENYTFLVFKIAFGAGIVVQLVKPLPPMPASHVGTGSSLTCSTFDPVPC